MDFWHAQIKTEGTQGPWWDGSRLLAALRVVARCGGSKLLLFNLLEDRGHLVLQGGHTAAARTAGAVVCALNHSFPESTSTATLSHLETPDLVDAVRLTVAHPSYPGGRHPASWPGTCFSDLVGARVLPGFDARRVGRTLRGLTPNAVAATVGFELPRPERVDWGGVGPEDLVAAACASVGVERLEGKRTDLCEARGTVCFVGVEVGMKPADLADALGIHRTTVQRSWAKAVHPHWIRLVCTQLAFQQMTRSL